MAPSSTKQPTRSSYRIKNIIKKKAAEPPAIAAANIPKKRKRAPAAKSKLTSKVTKTKKRAPAARGKTLHYFVTPDQLAAVTEEHAANKHPYNWASGHFTVAADGDEIPAGSLEVLIKVPEGIKFLQFPEVLNLVDPREGEEATQATETQGGVEEESSDSELSECGYVSDIHV